MIEKEVKTYREGINKWRDNRYSFMSEMNIKAGITDFGKAKKKGNKYKHIILLDKNNNYNFLGEQEILRQVLERFDDGKAGDLERVLTNTVASQACCFNLFSPLKISKYNFLADKIFSNLLNKEVSVSNIEIEFTPNKSESIGDQSKLAGTDADIGVFYNYENKKGVILIEFKYIENEFSVCTSYSKKNGRVKNGIETKNIRPLCNENYYKSMISENLKGKNKSEKFDCGYLKYENWDLTNNSSVFNKDKIQQQNTCPFRFSLNQLWRNMLLAEKVAEYRKLDEFHFWVVSPKENTFLWNNHRLNNETALREILTNKGNERFKSLELDKDFISKLEDYTNDKWSKEWLRKFREKYLTNTE
jgi:PD-(D/E)XK nuclease superfamily